jgi:hypothetical protein
MAKKAQRGSQFDTFKQFEQTVKLQFSAWQTDRYNPVCGKNTKPIQVVDDYLIECYSRDHGTAGATEEISAGILQYCTGLREKGTPAST